MISLNDLIWPMFVTSGKDSEEPISAMPGVNRLGMDKIVEAAKHAAILGIPVIALFPNTPTEKRTPDGDESINPDNLVSTATRAIKDAGIEIKVMLDAALDPYTTHGHDGIIRNGVVANDETVEILVRQSLVQAQAGADIIGPSDMMDGRVGAIRQALDSNGFEHVKINAYAAKFASSFYGPFRDAVGVVSDNAHGPSDKFTYQIDPANTDEAMREIAQDILEGADAIIIKPGLPYLDIISRARCRFHEELIAYQVSGEYSMIQSAAEAGWIDGPSSMWESMNAFKRAGADKVLTYFAPVIAHQLTDEMGDNPSH